MISAFALMLIAFAALMILGVPLVFSMLLSCILYFLMENQPLYLVAVQRHGHLHHHGDPVLHAGRGSDGGVGYRRTAATLCRPAGRTLPRRCRLRQRRRQHAVRGCSGSAIADIAALGKMQVRMMENSGFSREFSAALTISTAIKGAIIPPSIPIVLVGAVTGSSIGAMLIGGLVPGGLVAVAMAITVFVVTRKMPVAPNPERSPREVATIVVQSLPFLLMPVIILGGILSGVFTPTEASAAAVAWGFLLLIVNVRGRINLHDLLRLLVRSGTLAAAVIMLSGTSNIFSWVLATEQVPALVASSIFQITDNPYLILLIINVFLLLWGLVMDMLPAIFIVIPILLPLAAKLGIDPVHFGVVCTFNLIIGLITPPYGTALFTGSIVFNMPIERIVRHTAPFFVAAISVLLFITYVPEAVLFLPRLMGLQ